MINGHQSPRGRVRMRTVFPCEWGDCQKMSEKTHVKYTVSSTYAGIKKTPEYPLQKKKGRTNAKFDSHPGLVFVLVQFKSSLISCKLNWKGARLIPSQVRKRIHIPSTVQPRFFYFAFKILNADKILLPGSRASFFYIWSLLTYLYWFHCLTEEYQDRLTPPVSAGLTENDVLSAMEIISTVICHEM